MQCVMKEVCTEHPQPQVDQVTGARSVVFSHFNQDQGAGRGELFALHNRMGLGQNGTQEKLTVRWIDRVLRVLTGTRDGGGVGGCQHASKAAIHCDGTNPAVSSVSFALMIRRMAPCSTPFCRRTLRRRMIAAVRHRRSALKIVTGYNRPRSSLDASHTLRRHCGSGPSRVPARYPNARRAKVSAPGLPQAVRS